MIRNKFTFLFFFVSLFLSLEIYAIENNNSVYFDNNLSNNKVKVLYAKYKTYPKVVYTKQRFDVTLGLDIFLDEDQFFRIHTKINDGINIKHIGNEIIWQMNADKEYETTLKFKATEEKFTFPKITVNIVDRNGEYIDSEELKKPTISFQKIAPNKEKYSDVIASKLEVNSIKSRQFSNNEIMVLMELEAKNANLEDFNLAKYSNQGIKDVISNKGYQKIFYFVMVPIFEKTISFEYYNPNESKFILVNLPITLEEEKLSTQTNLNPYENDITIYKRMILLIIILISIIIYIFRKKKKYLYIAMIIMIVLISFSLPNKKIYLNEDEKVYILPTENSTIFKILANTEEVEVIGNNTTGKYTKVLFKNKQIGWIKND